jgi:hypothetical protein
MYVPEPPSSSCCNKSRPVNLTINFTNWACATSDQDMVIWNFFACNENLQLLYSDWSLVFLFYTEPRSLRLSLLRCGSLAPCLCCNLPI